MKKLLTLTALALSMGLSSVSFADTNIFGVNTQAQDQSSAVSIQGRDVQNKLNDLYLNSNDRIKSDSQEVVNESNNDARYVFGVKINA